MIKLVDCTRLVYRRLFCRFRSDVVWLLTWMLNVNNRISIVLETTTAIAIAIQATYTNTQMAFLGCTLIYRVNENPFIIYFLLLYSFHSVINLIGIWIYDLSRHFQTFNRYKFPSIVKYRITRCIFCGRKTSILLLYFEFWPDFIARSILFTLRKYEPLYLDTRSISLVHAAVSPCYLRIKKQSRGSGVWIFFITVTAHDIRNVFSFMTFLARMYAIRINEEHV